LGQKKIQSTTKKQYMMPWPYLGQMTDEELQALWLYLQSLPSLEQGQERTDL
jgi:hypothetical protein